MSVVDLLDGVVVFFAAAGGGFVAPLGLRKLAIPSLLASPTRLIPAHESRCEIRLEEASKSGCESSQLGGVVVFSPVVERGKSGEDRGQWPRSVFIVVMRRCLCSDSLQEGHRAPTLKKKTNKAVVPDQIFLGFCIEICHHS